MSIVDTLDELAGAATAAPSDYARCRYERRLTRAVTVSTGGSASTVNRSEGGLVQGFSGRRTGLAPFARPALAVPAAKSLQLTLQTRCSIAPTAPPAIQFDPEQPEPDSNTLRDRTDQLHELVQVLAGQKFVLSAMGRLQVNWFHRQFADSAGARLSWHGEVWRAEITMLVSDGNVFRPLYVPLRVSGPDCSPAAIVEEAAHTVMAERIEPGPYDVVLHPDVTALLVHEAVGHTLEADYHLADPSLAAHCRPGTTVGIDDLTVFDVAFPDPMPDDEGTVSDRVDLIRSGQIVGRLHSLETAALTGEQPTGNGRAVDWRYTPIPRMRTVIMSPGKTSDADLLTDVRRGVYIRRAVSGDTDGWNVALSGTLAYRIEAGQMSAPVAGVSLSGTAWELLRGIDAIGARALPATPSACNKHGQDGLPTWAAAPPVRLRGVQLG